MDSAIQTSLASITCGLPQMISCTLIDAVEAAADYFEYSQNDAALKNVKIATEQLASIYINSREYNVDFARALKDARELTEEELFNRFDINFIGSIIDGVICSVEKAYIEVISGQNHMMSN